MAEIKHYIYSISGLWNSYGCPPDAGEGLSISIESTNDDNESLAELCGLPEETIDIGRIAESKEISELVVILPMIEVQIPPTVIPSETNPQVIEIDCNDCNEADTGCSSAPDENKQMEKPKDVKSKETGNNIELVKYNNTEGAYLFLIQENIVNKILDVKDYKKLSIFEIKNILDKKINLNENNNIVKLMRAMVNYNFPPHLNWLAFPKTIKPIAMYVAEFKTTLSKDDLTKIWQGTMPQIAQEPEEEEIDIEHFIFDEEIFGNVKIAELENVKLKIFKCKKRASHYYNDLLYGKTIQNRKWYNYNWPYDNFSLIELLKVEAGEVHDFKNTHLPSDGVLNIQQNVSVTYSTDGTVQSTFNGYSDQDSVFDGVPSGPLGRFKNRGY